MYTAEDYLQNSMRSRAQNIQDNFGLKPQDYQEYRSQNGGYGFLAGMAWMIAGIAIAALVGIVAVHAAAAYLTAGLITGICAGAISMIAQEHRVYNGYSSYLDQVSAQGRAMRDRGPSVNASLEYDNGAGRTRSYSAELETSRQQVAVNNQR
jgi:hypothetical protein